MKAALLVALVLILGTPLSPALTNPQAAPKYSDPGIETFPDEGNATVPVGTLIVYGTDPPTSGSLYPDPQTGGYYESPIPPGFLVHSMEQSGVILYYNPATVTDPEKYSLMLLARAHPGVMAMVVCVPRADPVYPIILTAWTHRLRLTTYDSNRINGFMTLFLGQGPEQGPASPAPLWPAPLLSRGKPVFATVDSADAPVLVDGEYGGSGPGLSWRPVTLPASVAIQIGSGYSSVLFSWKTPGSAPDYAATAPAPQAYTVETSPNSTTGADGTWTTALTITNNTVRARAHSISFRGMSWINTFTRLDGMLLGSLVAALSRQKGGLRPYLAAFRGLLGSCALGLLLVMALGGRIRGLYPYCAQTVVFTLIAGCFASAMVLVLEAPPASRMRAFLSGRFLQACGKYSYAMYIVNIPILLLIGLVTGTAVHPVFGSRILGIVATGTWGIVASLGAAWLTWNLLEKHCLKLKRHFVAT